MRELTAKLVFKVNIEEAIMIGSHPEMSSLVESEITSDYMRIHGHRDALACDIGVRVGPFFPV